MEQRDDVSAEPSRFPVLPLCFLTLAGDAVLTAAEGLAAEVISLVVLQVSTRVNNENKAINTFKEQRESSLPPFKPVLLGMCWLRTSVLATDERGKVMFGVIFLVFAMHSQQVLGRAIGLWHLPPVPVRRDRGDVDLFMSTKPIHPFLIEGTGVANLAGKGSRGHRHSDRQGDSREKEKSSQH
jgi:hypothetical protein